MQLSRCSFESQMERKAKRTDLAANAGDCKLVLFAEAALNSDATTIIPAVGE
jgi:hypothetical protein